MHVTGIIAEYNPFHGGHAYHVAEARRLGRPDLVVAVMSGHITQRGEIAFCDKWTRAAMAVAGGVDLVFELPAVFAVRSAENFAAGGVRLLAALGVTGSLSFGVETGTPEQLAVVAAEIDQPRVVGGLKQNLRAGHSYAASLVAALADSGHVADDFVASPNNILGLEYLRALKRFAPHLVPLPVRRIGSGYHATGIAGELSSATAIRRRISSGEGVPADAAAALPAASRALLSRRISEGSAPADPGRLDVHLLAKLRCLSRAELDNLPECSEGLQNRLIAAAQQAGDTPGLLAALKTKRYPYSRLQRIVAHILLGTTRDALAEFDRAGPLYARVLAANRVGQSALRLFSRTSSLPVITRTAAVLNSRMLRDRLLSPLQTMLMYDIRATDLWALCLPSPAARIGGLDFLHSAICSKDT